VDRRHAPDADALAARFVDVRAVTAALAAVLSAEDAQVQSMPDASPTKWHLAHVTWFFETFVLERFEPGFRPFDPAFRVLFNSYYQGVGERHPRPRRGLLTRPTLAQVLAYRAAVEERVLALLRQPQRREVHELIELGLHHEQQHQELILTDALHLLSCHPLLPAYREPVVAAADAPADASAGAADAAAERWVPFDGGLVSVGHRGEGFAFDNESPAHDRFLAPFELADRAVTNAQWVAFVDDGGYRDSRWWLSAGWDWLAAGRVEAPLYWVRGERGWWRFGLHGLLPLAADEPVLHLSFYEADAYARWAGAQQGGGAAPRLPTEFEWEHAAVRAGAAAFDGANLLDSGLLHPRPAAAAPGGRARQLIGDVWEWTRSAYEPYPGFRPWEGEVGEYNGKFMVDQIVLRGGSFATPRSHIRATYRNFFPSPTRWQFAGLRLARDAR
jgi:ergothioneine biosynthesis protein EgtB